MYVPSQEILEKYARLLVNFALNEGKGVQPWEVVYVQIPECAKPLYIPLQKTILEAWAFPLFQYLADGVEKNFYEYASNQLLEYFPKDIMISRANTIDYTLAILASDDKHELETIEPTKIFKRTRGIKFYRDILQEREKNGEYTWCLALYGTAAMAAEAGCSEEEYRNQIIEACYLDKDDPIAERKKIRSSIEEVKKYLDALPIESLHIQGQDADLKISLGKSRKRLWGGWRNIPSFEVYVSPDRRGTEGWIRFNQPLYRHGVLMKDIELQFKEGVVVSATASSNQEALKEMIAQENADKVGEFSLTDRRFSRITRFMAETLYDENVWGEFGNTHIAIGNSFKDAYAGDATVLSAEERTGLWFNESVIHTDIISTTNRIVTAKLTDGSEHVIYKDWQFVFID